MDEKKERAIIDMIIELTDGIAKLADGMGLPASIVANATTDNIVKTLREHWPQIFKDNNKAT